MGLFSGSKTIKVSSTVYNMAGEEANRPNFMKSTIFAATMNPNKVYLGESLVNAYLSGPGINQRSLFNYAVRTDYPGLPTYSISKTVVINPEVIRPYITIPGSPVGLQLIIENAQIADGDYEVFAEQYMLLNFPLEAAGNWVAEYSVNDHTITIQRSGGSTVNFPAGAYDSQSRFVTSNYYFVLPQEVQALVPGPLTTAVTGGLPTTTGYTLTSTTNTGLVTYVQDQTRVVTKVYSNGSPTTTTTDYPHTETPFNTIYTIHEKEDYNGGDGTSLQTSKTKTFRRVWEYRQVYSSSSSTTVVNDIGGGHTETVTTNISGDFLRTVYNWQVDTQETKLSVPIGGSQIFIYKIGTGNIVLDALNVEVGSAVTAEFFPIIPIRLNNVSITDPTYEALYVSTKTLYRRATRRQKFVDLVEKVEENEDLEEIDYAYIQWAVTLNSKDKEALKYLYAFWKNLIPIHGLASTYLNEFVTSFDVYETAIAVLTAWKAAQSNPLDPLYNTTQPVVPSFGTPKITTLKFKTDHAQLEDFDNRISFTLVTEDLYSGLGKVDAVKGDLWTVKETPYTWFTEKTVHSSGESDTVTVANTMPVWSIYWQTDTDQYKKVTVYGAFHENFIYGGKSVKVTSDEAWDDVDDSGFLIPLHMPSLKEAGLVSATQLSTANTYIVFNSYQVFKKKWYQTFFGMLFIIIAVVIVAALIAPGTIGSVSGVFGTNATLGASFGLSGTGAIVAGAVANALAGILISQALSLGATAVFGEKWGALIGSLLSFVVGFGLTNGFGNLADIFQPANLLSLSSALANGYQGFVQGSIAEMNDELFKIGENYEKEMDRIQELLNKLIGNDLAFDPIALTDAAKGNGSQTGRYLPESLDEFIQRTTLTGSDVVDLTLSIINDFADLSLTLPRT